MILIHFIREILIVKWEAGEIFRNYASLQLTFLNMAVIIKIFLMIKLLPHICNKPEIEEIPFRKLGKFELI